MKLLLAGATGLVGRHVLELALADPAVTEVVAPVRRALPAHAKLFAPTVDFEQLPDDAGWWQSDAVICTLGTTMKAAGSRAAFQRVDHDYPLAIARCARRHGTPCFVLTSALGANRWSRFFYNQVKGELEHDLAGLGFASLTFVRPGMIGGHRDEPRSGEVLTLRTLQLLGPLLPKRWRINPAERIAQALLASARTRVGGVHVVSSSALN